MNLRSWELRVLGAAYLLAFTGDALWRAMLAGYATLDLGLGGAEVGMLYSAAALPGLLVVLVLRLACPRGSLGRLLVSAAFVAVAGLLCAALAQGLSMLLVAALLIGTGMTCFYVIANGICLFDSVPGHVPRTLGRLKSLGPVASIIAALGIMSTPVAFGALDARVTLLAAAAAVAMGALVVLYYFGVTPGRAVTGARGRAQMCWRLALWPYYALNFIAGARSALFKSFVIVFLVREYGVDIKTTAGLVLAGNLCAFVGYRVIGACLERFGRGAVLAAIYAVVFLCFTGFWLVAAHGSASTLATRLLEGLFLLDSLVFGASVVTDSYLRSAAPRREAAGHLAAGTAMYAFAGVCVPLLAGLAWHGAEPHRVFLLGVVLAVLGAGLAQLLERRENAPRPARALVRGATQRAVARC